MTVLEDRRLGRGKCHKCKNEEWQISNMLSFFLKLSQFFRKTEKFFRKTLPFLKFVNFANLPRSHSSVMSYFLIGFSEFFSLLHSCGICYLQFPTAHQIVLEVCMWHLYRNVMQEGKWGCLQLLVHLYPFGKSAAVDPEAGINTICCQCTVSWETKKDCFLF